jgi:hypothetical protein
MLQCDIYFNDDQSECIVLERYRDSEAAIEHAANLGDLFGAVLATVSVVHGELSNPPLLPCRRVGRYSVGAALPEHADGGVSGRDVKSPRSS